MATGDLLLNGAGLPYPQRAKIGHGLTPASGDTTNLEISTKEVTPVAQRIHIGNVGKTLAKVELVFARPADTTPYADGDAVSDSTSAPTVLTFANIAAENGGTGLVARARLASDNASAATKTFTLHLFSVAVAGQNDNDALAIAYADLDGYIGAVDFTLALVAGTAFAQALPALPFICDAGTDNLYGLLEVTGAYTPTSGESVTIELLVEQY